MDGMSPRKQIASGGRLLAKVNRHGCRPQVSFVLGNTQNSLVTSSVALI